MNRAQLLNFTKQDFIDRYSGSVLGVGWSFIWPIVMIAIYIVIFGRIMGARIPGIDNIYGYGIYLVAGLVPWTAFSNTVIRTTTVFIEKKSIITKVNLSLLALPLYVVLSESITMLITMAIFMIFLLVTGYPLHDTLLLFPFIFVLQQIFAYGLGLLFGVFNVFIRDIQQAVGVLMQLWFWGTPIVYIISILPAPVRTLEQYNPIFVFINAYHQIFLTGAPLSMSGLLKAVVMVHVVLFIGYVAFKILERDIRDFV